MKNTKNKLSSSVISSDNEKSSLVPKLKIESKSSLLSWIPFFKGMTKKEKNTNLLLKTKNYKLKTTSNSISYKLLAFSSKQAFTLVELIVVISILSILGTIAFVSFGSYSSSARDSVKMSDLANISKGLELFNTTAGTYPLPENITGTGEVNGVVLSYVGILGDNTARIIKFSETPKDKVSNSNFMYGVDTERKFYQVSAVLENPVVYNTNPFIPTANAGANNYQSIVKGNYKGLLVRGTNLYNLPSLLFTGSGNLLSTGPTGTFFVANKSTNLPYIPDSKTTIANQTPSDILTLVGNTAASVTGVTITESNYKTMTGAIGYSEDVIGTTFFGVTKYSEIKDKVIPVVPVTFPITCHFTDTPITYAQAQANQIIIYNGANSLYNGCRISDYPGGENAIIAGQTVGNKVLVAYYKDEDTTLQFKTSNDTTAGLADSGANTDGLVNTNTMISVSGTAHPAAQACRTGKDSSWYLPAKDELASIYTNIKVPGYSTFAGNNYWSSSPYYAYNSWIQYFTDGYQGYGSKSNSIYVRCASRF